MSSSLSGSVLPIITLAVWVVFVLVGLGIGMLLGGLVGTFLGWLAANTLDESIVRGGRIGRLLGRLCGAATGAFLGIMGAIQVTALIVHALPHAP